MKNQIGDAVAKRIIRAFKLVKIGVQDNVHTHTKLLIQYHLLKYYLYILQRRKRISRLYYFATFTWI